jgi:acyl-coenzyme A synthetase/AMP-(fatty) acid ligase
MSTQTQPENTLWDVLCARAAAQPTAPLLVPLGAAPLGAAALRRAALHQALALQARGVRAGDRALVQLLNATELLVSTLALWRLGAVPVLLHPAEPPQKAAELLARSGAQHALSGGGFAIFPAEAPDDAALESEARLGPPPTAEAPAAVFCTSGSTGDPLLVLHAHGPLRRCAQGVVEGLGLREDDVLMGALPFSFHYGFSQFSAALCAGAALCPTGPLLPGDLLAALKGAQVTVCALVPTQLAALAEAAAGAPLPHLRLLTSAGARLPDATRALLQSTLPGAVLHELYGATECLRSLRLGPEHGAGGGGRLGAPVPGVRVAVVVEGPGGLRLAAPDEPGELVHAGDLLCIGYLDAPEEAAARLRPCPPLGADRAFFTGDQARRDASGALFFLGRTDARWGVGGVRVGAAPTEAACLALPGVAEAVAFAVPDPLLGQRIEVALRLLPEAPPLARLIAALRGVLPPWSQPRRLHPWAGPWPSTPNGKIDRHAILAKLHPATAPTS